MLSRCNGDEDENAKAKHEVLQGIIVQYQDCKTKN